MKSTAIQKLERMIDNLAKTGKDTTQALDFLNGLLNEQIQKESTEEWKKNNLEYDICYTNWIVEKIKSNSTYAEHVYAALCNNTWQKLDPILILKESQWSCTWRQAGIIISNVIGKGNYTDWYLNGCEGTVTSEVQEDFRNLGWALVQDLDNDQAN